jgi:hypothetical protein
MFSPSLFNSFLITNFVPFPFYPGVYLLEGGYPSEISALNKP